MGKKAKAKQNDIFGMPKAPWIFVRDPHASHNVGKQLSALIPEAIYMPLFNHNLSVIESPHPIVFTRHHDNEEDELALANSVRTMAISKGINFASIEVLDIGARVDKTKYWGTNHLDIERGLGVVDRIYKWLFTVLTVRETLHLIPEHEMRATDTVNFPEYAYCPVSESSLRPKNAKIQFVALVLSKPQISDDNKLTWSVVDRSGVANFYFQFRDDQSQYTWDWVLGLKPGDRRALPRMPRIEVKERKRVRVVKAPFRATGAILLGTSLAIRAVGHGLGSLGHAIKMGSSSEWVPEADIGSDGKRINWSQKRAWAENIERQPEKKHIKVFNEKGEKTWSDGASIASTDIGSDFNGEKGKEFV